MSLSIHVISSDGAEKTLSGDIEVQYTNGIVAVVEALPDGSFAIPASGSVISWRVVGPWIPFDSGHVREIKS